MVLLGWGLLAMRQLVVLLVIRQVWVVSHVTGGSSDLCERCVLLGMPQVCLVSDAIRQVCLVSEATGVSSE